MSSTLINTCIYCNKECKSSDSRPYPNSKSKERIHNRCQIKKILTDKKQPSSKAIASIDDLPSNSVELPTASSLIEKVTKEEYDINRAASDRKFARLVEDKMKHTEKISDTANNFFFDLKAGIAKPHEKRRYLHHRNLCEISARYDDNGFNEEAVGRAYDHTGKDLNTLGDDKNESDNEIDTAQQPNNEDQLKLRGEIRKRKSNHKANTDKWEDRKHSRVKLDEQNPCWFCLSSPKVEKHLIVAIGDFCYLTLAKGGLTDEHFLLIPIEHIQSLNDKEGNSVELLEELEKFKKSLVEYFGRKSMGVVFFERNFRSIHWQLQVVPIPLNIIDTIENDVKTISKRHFKNCNYLDIPDNCSLSDIIPPAVPYFYWQLEPIGSRFVTQIQIKGSFFSVQFGRVVLADPSILDCTEKVDWKTCTKTKDEYLDIVKQTKKEYMEFDFT